MTGCSAGLDRYVLIFRKAGVLEAEPNFRDVASEHTVERGTREQPDDPHRRLLRAGRDRPRRRAAEESDERAASHMNSQVEKATPDHERRRAGGAHAAV